MRTLNSKCPMYEKCIFGVPDKPENCRAYRSPQNPGTFCTQLILKTEFQDDTGTVFNLKRRFGVELEMFWTSKSSMRELQTSMEKNNIQYFGDGDSYGHAVGRQQKKWEFTTDSSLTHTRHEDFGDVELKTPVLRGHEGLEQLQEVMSMVAAQDLCYVNTSCGAHVHHEVVDLWTKNPYFAHNLYILYWKVQPILEKLVAPSRAKNDYCRKLIPIRDLLTCRYPTRNADPYATTSMLSNWFTRWSAYTTNGSYSRYNALNLNSYLTRGTVEFRLHGGTTDAVKLGAWIILTQALVELAGATVKPITPYVRQAKTLSSLWKLLQWDKVFDGLQIVARTYLTKRFEMFSKKARQGTGPIRGEVEELGVEEQYITEQQLRRQPDPTPALTRATHQFSRGCRCVDCGLVNTIYRHLHECGACIPAWFMDAYNSCVEYELRFYPIEQSLAIAYLHLLENLRLRMVHPQCTCITCSNVSATPEDVVITARGEI